MTPAEKRYFKVHYANAPNALASLFDKLNAMDTYDESILRSILPDNISENLKVFKVKLQDRLLKAMTSYFAKKNVLSKIRYGLEEVDLLMGKQLYDIAADQLSKVKKIAVKYEEYTYLLEIATIELRLSSVYIDKEGISQNPVLNSLQIYINRLQEQNFFIQRSHAMIDHQKNNYFKAISDQEKASLQQFLTETTETYKEEDLTFRSKLSLNIIRAVIYKRLKWLAEEYKARKKNVELFNTYTFFKESFTFNYLAVLRNYMNFCLENGRYDQVEETIKEAKSFINNKTPKERPQIIYFDFAALKMFLDKGAFDQMVEEFGETIEAFAKKHHILKERITIFSFAFLYVAELVREQYKQALYYHRLINDATPDIKQGHNLFFIIMELIVHYESGDHYSLRNLLSKIKRKYKFSSAPASFFKSIIQWQEAVLNFPSDARIHTLQLKSEIDQKFNSDKNLELMKYYHLNYWWEAILNQRSLREELIAASKRAASS